MSTELKINKISLLNVLRKIGLQLDASRKGNIKFVLLLSVFCSFAESISLAMLVPFISFFVNPENYISNNFFKTFFGFLSITDQKDILTFVSISFISVVLLTSFIRLKYIKFSNKLTDNISSDFRIKIFKFLINQNFSYYFKHGSNEILSNLAQKTAAFSIVLFATINIITSSLISLAIITILIINEPFYTPLIITSIILFFAIVFKIKSSSILNKGQNINSNQNFMFDILQNAVGYLPEIIIYNLRSFFLKTLSKISKEIAASGANIRTVGMYPKIYLETFIIIFVVFLIYFSELNERSIETNISYLAILAFGAQKCLPLINNIYSLGISIKSNLPSVNSFLSILDGGTREEISEQNIKVLKFEKNIQLKNISFQYNKNSSNIINNLNLNLIKGQKIAIKGQTGSGKSTLANIISGLLKPSEGQIFVDNILIDNKNLISWQKNIAIVPQTIFLNDATIVENIAIAQDINTINLERVKSSVKLAQIDKFIESLPNKLNERVGERGVRLSGGQRQRIGIARALYRNAKIIILDEPTNALDLETEKLVLDSITKLGSEITLLMISHSDNSLDYFDKIIDLDKI